jgi:peroxin-5
VCRGSWVQRGETQTDTAAVAVPNAFESLSAIAAWTDATRLLATGGSLSDATLLLETFLQLATLKDYQTIQATNVEAWSLLGRTHAMNEKEEKALSAFQQGQRALEGEDDGREKVVGEMLTVRIGVTDRPGHC